MLVKIILIPPVSTACCEPGFFCVKELKITWSTLTTKTLDAHFCQWKISGRVRPHASYKALSGGRQAGRQGRDPDGPNLDHA